MQPEMQVIKGYSLMHQECLVLAQRRIERRNPIGKAAQMETGPNMLSPRPRRCPLQGRRRSRARCMVKTWNIPRLLHPHPWPILNRFRQLIRCNHITLRQIRNRPRQLQHPVKRPCGKMELLHRRLQQLLRRWLHSTEHAHLRWLHLCIAGQLRPLKPLELPLPCRLHPFPNRLRILHIALIRQLLIIHSRHLHMDINAIQQWAH